MLPDPTISSPRDEIRLWRDAALGAHGVELVMGRCFEHRYRPHFHDEFSIAVFLRGAQKYRVGRHTGVAVPGSVVIIPPGETHAAEAVFQHEGWSFRAFYPDRETLDELSRELFVDLRGKIVEFDVSPWHQDVGLARCLSAQHRIIECESDALARQNAFASAMASLVSRYGGPRHAIRAIRHEPQAIRRAMDCANARFNESTLGITDLAGAAGLSAYHFMRCFRATTGLTAHQYVLQLRLREARRLLAQGTSPSDVAGTVGFADQSHMIRHFRTAFGLTPGMYAKMTLQRA